MSDIEHLFTCLLGVCMYFLEKCLLSPLPIFQLDYMLGFGFFWGLVCVCVCVCVCSLHILVINSLFYLSFTTVFSHSVGSLLVLLRVSLTVQKLFILL